MTFASTSTSPSHDGAENSASSPENSASEITIGEGHPEHALGAGRFAPSPSGDLHLGNLRTALLARMWARLTDRRFVLRIEDIDRVRSGSAQRQLDELKAELVREDKENSTKELGDFLFSVINAARLYKLNPDNALEHTNQKFISRFTYVEQQAKKLGKELKNMTLDEMDNLWNEAKKIENNK